jgi:esterase FrsA
MSYATIKTDEGLIYYRGPALELGPMPAVIYFALSGSASLHQDPFNQPINDLVNRGHVRVFSWDLPFHGEMDDPKEALHQWSIAIHQNPAFLIDFLKYCQRQMDYLIQQELIEETSLGIAGLSRGGFVATHLAAFDSRFKYIVGFAPMTQTQVEQETLHLKHVAHLLTSKFLRFYIGNHDTRVGTRACFDFIEAIVQHAHRQGIRSSQSELIIYPSIGHKGHGTPPTIFKDGARWMKNMLVPSHALDLFRNADGLDSKEIY